VCVFLGTQWLRPLAGVIFFRWTKHKFVESIIVEMSVIG